MQPLVIPSAAELDFETFRKWAMELIQTLRMNCEMWQTVAHQQKVENAKILAQNIERDKELERLQARIDHLEKQLRQNSSNSSKPPSSDPLYKARKLLSTVRSKKKPGGQPGHQKHEQKVIATEDVRQVIPKICKDCQGPLVGKDPEPLFHQQIDIPPILPKVIHHFVHRLTCNRCGTVTKGQIPEPLRPSYGPRLEALVSHLTGAYRFSKRKIVGLFDEVFGTPISLGMVCKLQRRTTQALEAGMAEIDGRIMNSEEPINVDETGQRVCGKLEYAWVASSPLAVKFRIGSRSRESFDKLVGESRGVITSDRYLVYHHLKSDRWQICWSHLNRNFQGVEEEKNEASPIGKILKETGLSLLKSFKKVRDGTRTRLAFMKNSLGKFQAKVRKALEKGSLFGKRKLATICQFLLDHWGSLWRFAFVERVEPTNNEAERQLRELVIYRKVSLCINSARGKRFVESIFSVIATCRLHKIKPLEYIRESIETYRWNKPSPILIPT